MLTIRLGDGSNWTADRQTSGVIAGVILHLSMQHDRSGKPSIFLFLINSLLRLVSFLIYFVKGNKPFVGTFFSVSTLPFFSAQNIPNRVLLISLPLSRSLLLSLFSQHTLRRTESGAVRSDKPRNIYCLQPQCLHLILLKSCRHKRQPTSLEQGYKQSHSDSSVQAKRIKRILLALVAPAGIPRAAISGGSSMSRRCVSTFSESKFAPFTQVLLKQQRAFLFPAGCSRFCVCVCSHPKPTANHRNIVHLIYKLCVFLDTFAVLYSQERKKSGGAQETL